MPDLRSLCIKSVKEFAYTMLCIFVMAIITCFCIVFSYWFFVDHICVILFIKSDYFIRVVVFFFSGDLSFQWKKRLSTQHPTNKTSYHFWIKFQFPCRFCFRNHAFSFYHLITATFLKMCLRCLSIFNTFMCFYFVIELCLKYH